MDYNYLKRKKQKEINIIRTSNNDETLDRTLVKKEVNMKKQKKQIKKGKKVIKKAKKGKK
ncbi:MAG: hypothetical protein GX445_02165 [Elusimicrobia bacterium]|nr:hypothetical protein [Elusimicrobiota bacterium]